jgi:DNA excision repair protein ERCC-3
VTHPPLVVQADHTILLEVRHPLYAETRDRLLRFAELTKSPEYVHFYKLSPISLWNAAALGEPLAGIVEFLGAAARYPVPKGVLQDLRDWYLRYGALRLKSAGQQLLLEADDEDLLAELCRQPGVQECLNGFVPRRLSVLVPGERRGALKQALVRLGHPVLDLAGYARGAPLALALRTTTGDGREFALRRYQAAAAEAFHAGGSLYGGSGVVVLPCGAGKTIVAMQAIHLLQTHCLVLTTNTVAVRQWKRELLDKTTLRPDQVGEYTGERKELAPVTIATYQILTWRRNRLQAAEHLQVFERGDWGLIVYDEVHLLPAPVFRMTAGLQARRRLGLTATLVREDRREDEVFSLIGPKRYEVPWKELEQQGYLAPARCVEVRVAMADERRRQHDAAPPRAQHRIAASNERKLWVVAALLARHADARVLVIGQYVEQLARLSSAFAIPLITGTTPIGERERLYAAFRAGGLPRLIVSKVGNFAIDLPDASVAIQVSGTFGSRQEEAQRLGRILRPKSGGGGAVFYSVVSEATREQDFAARRQRFLTEQGYAYEIIGAPQFLDGGPA